MADTQVQNKPNQRNDRNDRGPRRDRNDRSRGQENAEDKMFVENVVSIDRVSRVVKGGRRFRFRALIVVGDGKGKVGIGVSKAGDVQAAVAKATDVAKKNMIDVALEGTTVPHEATGKIAGARILIMPAREGTGLIAGGVVRTVLEAAGVQNILSKSLGSSNKINSAYATIDALSQMVQAKDWVTAGTSESKKEKK